MIYILIFLSIAQQPLYGTELVQAMDRRTNECGVKIEVYETIEQVNQRINDNKPDRIYSYNLKTKELKMVQFEYYAVIKESEER